MGAGVGVGVGGWVGGCVSRVDVDLSYPRTHPGFFPLDFDHLFCLVACAPIFLLAFLDRRVTTKHQPPRIDSLDPFHR